MGEKKTVVFAADNNYACQMIIAVCSLLSSLRECRDYQLVLLVSSDFKEENVEANLSEQKNEEEAENSNKEESKESENAVS